MGRASLAERPRTAQRNTSAPASLLETVRKTFDTSWFACAVLLVLSLIAYCATWDSYFLCDDFALISYIHNAMSAPLVLLREFTGSTVADYQITARLYRPLYLVNLLVSYLLFGTNPAGYHLVNFLAHFACSIAFYASVRTVLGDLIDARQKQLLALAGAALFATSPLHLEVINFSASSSDTTALLLSLLSFSLFVQWSKGSAGKRILTIAASLACFAAAILIKETAAAIPFIAAAWLLFLGSGNSIRQKCAQVFPFFVVLAAYLSARYFALGTLIGGYSGSPGEAFARTWGERLSMQSLVKVLFPINESLANPPGFVLFLLATAFAGTFILAALRLRAAVMKPDRQFNNSTGKFASLTTALKVDAFGLVWLLLALLPVLPVWQATANLAGVRYFMSASAAFYLLIVWQLRSTNTVFSRTIAITSFACLLLANLALSQFNSTGWSEAALQSQRIQQEATLLAHRFPTQKIALLNLPADVCGTTMFLTDRMLKPVMAPPFAPSIHDHFVATELDSYTPQLINTARARQLAASDNVSFFTWNKYTAASKKLNLAPSSPDMVMDAVALIPCHTSKQEGQWFELIFDRKIPRLDSDFFEVHFATHDETKAIPTDDIVMVAWNSDIESGKYSSVSAHPTGWNCDKYVFALSEQTSWISSPESNTLLLKMPHGQVPTSATIINGSQYVARLQPEHISANCAAQCKPDAVLRFDATSIEGATTCCLEISRNNVQYQVFDASYRSNRPSTVTAQTIPLTGLQGSATISEKQFSCPGYYQVRLRATDAAGETVGFVSDPVTIEVLPHMNNQLAHNR